ncbi:protein FAR1-RELATED SEQUENCE 5-like [Vitis riparia]|uniref:protein FAR1-RELATED SEQUENCE 5-like n=1 Tax=Vitis riparia TaxID=96939 RepID=UPI00155A600A|nr:protein FAR1-RELATED SEQUENCE 5-like [Vitis riparia]
MAVWFGVEGFRGNGREGSRTRRVGSRMEDRLPHGYFVKMKKKAEEWEWSVMEKTIKQEFEVKAEDVVNDDAYTGGTYKLGGNGWEEKVLKGISVEEVCKMKFACIDEAETFYNMLAKLTGFSIRKDDLKRDKNGDIISRKWVCSKEGHRATKFIENDNRQREPRSLTRVGCEAAFRVGLNRKDGKWIVKEFIGDHNHNLVDAINRQFLRGHEHVGFTQKDIYNHVDAMRRSEIKDGDAEAALAYLCGKAEMDSSFFYKFNIDEESRLANLFWADSTARMDYACFGDVLAFDTTYRTNAYKKPLVVLVGVNHHHQTVVFGCALLIDESVGTYEWVLETFLEAMMNKKPISVVTDGDKAMRKAIKKVLPDTCHRLCSWHLQRNAFTNVHIKDFSSIFARCMFMRGNEEEFEKVWHEMVANLGLNENRWVTEIYGKRKRWAEAYLRGNFFGGMRTTQRCESMNAYLNRFLKIRLRLYEFVQQFDRAIMRIRQNEAKAEFESNNSSPVLSTKLSIIENHAATVYTKESFIKFREEMKNAELFFVVGLGMLGEQLSNDRSDMYIDCGELNNLKKTMECACADSRISAT